MSAPRTPAEMADWLEEKWRIDILPEEETLDIVAFLRSLPTDAQKIEALKEAAESAVMGAAAEAFDEAGDAQFSGVAARSAASDARMALRLLGLPTGDEPR